MSSTASRDRYTPAHAAKVAFFGSLFAARPDAHGLRWDELEGYWPARRGQYRVIYSFHDDEVLVRVVRISQRADAHG